MSSCCGSGRNGVGGTECEERNGRNGLGETDSEDLSRRIGVDGTEWDSSDWD